jgi:ATP-dependent Clp protease, protease subunit
VTFPYRPGDPAMPPVKANAADAMAPWLEERLFDRRVVMVRGPLVGSTASHVAAALLTLDALATDPIQIHIGAVDGELSAAYAIVDAIDAMRAKVRAIVPSMAGGASIAILAAADRRLAFRHARIKLTEPRATLATGTAEQVAAAAGEYLRELEELIVRLTNVTGQPRSRIEDDLAAGRVLSAEEAVDYGLIDEIVSPANK